MRRSIYFILVILAATSCKLLKSSSDSTPSSMMVTSINESTTPSENGILYALPETVIDVVIETEKTTEKRGQFYRYSERYLGLTNVILEDKETYSIKSIQLVPRGVTDSNKWYKITFNGNASAPMVNLDSDGKILGINTTIDRPNPICRVSTTLLPNDTSFSNTPFTEDQLIVSSSAKMAEECASYIYDIRRARTEIISGTAPLLPTDGKAYELSLNEITRLEKEFIELFKGKTAKQTIYSTITFTPEKELTKEVLFRFSRYAGVVSKNDISGEPIYLSLKKQELPDFTSKQIETEETENALNNKGLCYTLPGKATIALEYLNKEITDGIFEIAQFGHVATLPTEILEHPSTSVVFYPTTGAIKSINKK